MMLQDKNLYQCYSAHQKSYREWPETEYGPPWWQPGDCLSHCMVQYLLGAMHNVLWLNAISHSVSLHQ